MDTPDELPTRILDAVARTKKRVVQPRRSTRDLRPRIAKFIESDDGILGLLLRTVTNLSFVCDRLLI